MHSTSRHLRDPCICVPQSGWIRPWRGLQIEGRGEATEEGAVAEAVGPLAGGTNFMEEKAEGEGGEWRWGGGVCWPRMLQLQRPIALSEERPQ